MHRLIKTLQPNKVAVSIYEIFCFLIFAFENKKQMNRAILPFRFKQLWKILKEIPLLYMILIIGMLAFASTYLYSALQKKTTAEIVSLIFLFLIFILHARRKDYHFMSIIEDQPRKVFCMEYLVISLPLLAVLLIHQHWLLALGLLMITPLIGLMKQRTATEGNSIRIPKFIPYSLFEVRSGLRQYGLIFLILYIAAWATLPFPYVSLGIF